jgi:hypothetical protein
MSYIRYSLFKCRIEIFSNHLKNAHPPTSDLTLTVFKSPTLKITTFLVRISMILISPTFHHPSWKWTSNLVQTCPVKTLITLPILTSKTNPPELLTKVMHNHLRRKTNSIPSSIIWQPKNIPFQMQEWSQKCCKSKNISIFWNTMEATRWLNLWKS